MRKKYTKEQSKSRKIPKTKHHIQNISQKWGNRKLEQDAIALQKAAGEHDYNPIWKYRRALMKRRQTNPYYTLYNDNGEETTTIAERQQRWTERVATCFSSQPEKLIPEIMHISETVWNTTHPNQANQNTEKDIPLQLQQIRTNSCIQTPPPNNIAKQKDGLPNHTLCVKYRTQYNNYATTKKQVQMGLQGKSIKY